MADENITRTFFKKFELLPVNSRFSAAVPVPNSNIRPRRRLKQTRTTHMNETESTYRLIELGDRSNVGQTASTPELAKLVPGDLARFAATRLGMERTDWVEHNGKPKIVRTVLIEAETQPHEWKIGVDPETETGGRLRLA